MDIIAARTCILAPGADPVPRIVPGKEGRSRRYHPHQISLLTLGHLPNEFRVSASITLHHSSHVDVVVLLYALSSLSLGGLLLLCHIIQMRLFDFPLCSVSDHPPSSQ